MWNGYRDLEESLNATILNSPLTILNQHSGGDTCLILIPYKPYNVSELNALKEFLDDGGTIILLNDYGYGNMILDYIDAPARFDENGILIDPLFHYKNSRLPVIMSFKQDTSTRNISRIVLNHASIIDILDSRAIILGESSFFSYFDRNLNYIYDEGEPKGPFPVYVKFKYGDGVVYVLSDPSIFLNSMIRLGDNMKLLKNIAGDKVILIDQYHLKMNLHYKIRQALLEALEFIRRPYVYPYFTISLIIAISYVIIRKISL